MAELRELPYVRAVVPYQPDYKVDAGLDLAAGDGSESGSCVLSCCSKGENVMSEVVEEIARAGGELHVQNLRHAEWKPR